VVKQRSKALGAKESAWGKALRALRGELGISLGALARAIGLSQKAVQEIEQTPDPTLSEVRRYVSGLGGDLELTLRLPEASIRTLARLEPQQLALGDFLVEPLVPRKDVVFSIRPIHAERILAGSKTVELRRRFSDSVGAGSFAFIYTTSPTSALTGLAEIRGVQQLPVKDLWHRYGEAACLSKLDFDEYFSGLRAGYAIVLSGAKPLSRVIDLEELRMRYDFEPPQSYQYAPARLRQLIANERPQTPHRH
jgi:predicted transcriptional regulator